MLAGPNDERPLGGDLAFLGSDRTLVELSDRQVGQDGAADPGRWNQGLDRHARYLDCDAGPLPALGHVTGRA